MNFIRKIFEGTIDMWVHKQFTRYGKGAYENKALLDITKSKNAYKIKTSFEYSGELALVLAEKLTNTVAVTGGIISKKDLKSELGSLVINVKQFAGVKTFEIAGDMDKHQIQDLFKKFPTNLILLSFKSSNGQLTSKIKSPKPAKVEKEEPPKPDYCTLLTEDEELVKDLLFDIKEENYKKVSINHSFIITGLSVPKEYENDIEQARLNALRKGKVVRKVNLDGKEIISEKDFEA